MRLRLYLLTAVLACRCVVSAQDTLSADTLGPYIPIPDDPVLGDTVLPMPTTYNPIVAGGLSAILPGSGQWYCKRRVKGGLYLLAEGITAAILINRAYAYSVRRDELDNWDEHLEYYRDSKASTLPSDSVQYASASSLFETTQLQYDRARYRRREARYVTYQSVGWVTGMHLWNIMDAVSSSNHFYNDEPRSPVVAGLLSAIPGLGLGQMYNGSFTKTGMVWLFQTMLGFQAYNYHNLMEDAEDQRAMFFDTTSWKNTYETEYVRIWTAQYRNAFRGRNTYLWYSVFFYFYGIFDAVVDAHLHDYRKKVRFETAYDPRDESMHLTATIEF